MVVEHVNPRKDPILAAILSGLIPGLGQIYCGRWGKGALFFFGIVVLGGIFPLLAIGIWVWGIVDAYGIAKNTQGGGVAGEGPVIDISRASFPQIDIRQVATYVGIPLGIAVLLAIMGFFALSRYGFLGVDHSGKKLEPLIARIEAYKDKTGVYPDTLLAMIDPTDPMEKRQILDSWSRFYRYRPTGSSFELSSSGKDGQPDTDDDIRYYP